MELRSARVIVTGGAGFLGRHVVAKLREDGCQKVVVPRRSQYDLIHEADVECLYAGVATGVVIHLAAVVGGIGANRANAGLCQSEYLVMGAMLMEYVRRAGGRNFVSVG